jgi:DNA polymerase III delta prime subunit
MSRVFVSYRHVEPDATVAHALAESLTAAGHEVFTDTRIPAAAVWGEVIEQKLADANCVIAVVSPAAGESPMVVTEVAHAHRLNLERGRPVIMPVRLGEGFRPRYPLSAYISRFQQLTWQSPADTPTLIERVKDGLVALSKPAGVASQRQGLIQRVRGDWIHGVLEKSLHHVVRLELGLTLDQTAVVRGVDLLLQRPGEATESLPVGTRLADVFDDHQGQLLILGAPGSGKTTLLLELARELLVRAENDEHYPIPVVFNLSSWAEQRPPLDEWMIAELNLRSDAPRKLAREWVTNELILPLLDGLDEVAGDSREACVLEINAYRREHGWVPVAVCCRKAEHDALTARLVLPGAVVIQPLERAQVEAALARAGEVLRGVTRALASHPSMWDVLDTPLMLSVVALAYRDATDEQAAPQDVFGKYIDSMFRRRAKETRYRESDMRAWLQWLAGNLVQRGQTVLFLEDVVPEWILGAHAKWATATMLVGVVALSSVWIWFLVGIFTVADAHWAWTTKAFFDFGWWQWPTFTAPLAVFLTLAHGRRAGPVDAQRFCFPGWETLTYAGLRSAAIGYATSAALSYSACVTTTDSGLTDSSTLGFANRFGIAGAAVLTAIFMARALFATRMTGERRAPGALVKRSAMSATLIFLASLVMSTPFILDIFDFVSAGDTIAGFELGMMFFSWGGLFMALNRGGYFLIRHYIARAMLWVQRRGPWNYTKFLDAATERVLLRNVGGGYIFVHRTLMEYLAGSSRSA